jgi:N4-(beta-N-acetylglucosaminyl)-L-asparaginase
MANGLPFPATGHFITGRITTMMPYLDRREFMSTGAALGAAVLPEPVAAGAPWIHIEKAVKPVVIAAWNGHVYKNNGPHTCVEKAFQMVAEGKDVLDAVIAGVNITELDPLDNSVGFGGLPNADGIVQLDSSCMHGPTKRAGAVACLEGVRTPSLVAKAVLELTDHHLLVGKDAQHFARMMGFTIEADLNTPQSRRLWLNWKRRIDPQHYLDPRKRAAAGWKATMEMVAEGLLDLDKLFGTINCSGVNAKGEVSGVTTTSGLAWKIPGRVGDSPILGAGCYVDNEVGAVGATGRGEANMYNLGSFLIMEGLRQGMAPKDAGMAALKRIVGNTVEKRLQKASGKPSFNLLFYILTAKGEHTSVAFYPGRKSKYAVCTEDGPRHIDCATMFDDVEVERDP